MSGRKEGSHLGTKASHREETEARMPSNPSRGKQCTATAGMLVGWADAAMLITHPEPGM